MIEPFAFLTQRVPARVARPASTRFNYAKTLVQSALISIFGLVIVPWAAWTVESFLGTPRFSFPIGLAIGLFVLNAGLAFWSQWVLVICGAGTPFPLDAPRHFVVRGPYRWVRNPMALGSLGQGFAIALGLGSPLIFGAMIVGTMLWNYVARPWEERDLTRRFGAPYLEYQSKVRCWWPRFRAYDALIVEAKEETF